MAELIPISEEIHAMKYRQNGETFDSAMARVAGALKDDDEHFKEFYHVLKHQMFLPGGRVQSAMGAARRVTAFNCFVMRTIPDSMDGIMETLAEAAETMRLGGGVGYDFSTLRPRGSRIVSLDSKSSGPVSFMGIFDAMCATIASAGHRRGAQMATMRCDHPDIEEFVNAKTNDYYLKHFNISVLVTDEFMEAVVADDDYPLMYDGRIYEWISARGLWEQIMRNTWDWAEPGVIFIDRVNTKNNLWYIEEICATNPCGEQPLPPYGACLLGSLNMTKFLSTDPYTEKLYIDYDMIAKYVPSIVRAMDNVIDRTTYPLDKQELEARRKRRMGLGVTGMANALESIGYVYGSDEYIKEQSNILELFRNECYKASIELAKEKGSFPLLDREKYIQSGFMKTMPSEIRKAILEHGIRNSHLLSIAPTGTISLTANNVSSGIEPVFSHEYTRTIQTFDGPRLEKVQDYAYRVFGVKGKTANELTPEEHVRVLNAASKYIDSACSKTCNVGDEVSFERFKNIYMEAWKGGASGCTTFRAAGKRYGILNASTSEDVAEPEPQEEDKFVNEKDGAQEFGAACYYDPVTGKKECE